jgi:hypothetical protein
LFHEHIVFSWWLVRAEDSGYSTVVRCRNYRAVGDENGLGCDWLTYAGRGFEAFPDGCCVSGREQVDHVMRFVRIAGLAILVESEAKVHAFTLTGALDHGEQSVKDASIQLGPFVAEKAANSFTLLVG